MADGPDLQVPVAVVWGRDDRILPLRLGVQLVQELTDARLEVIDDAGHSPMLEQPQAFEEALRRAVRAHS
jgi:3-oxoadipate enol-lactonase